MSSIKAQIVKCPKCGKANSFETYESVNVTTDPDLKEKILNQSAFSYKCSCGCHTHMFYPMLYHDMRLKIMIQLCATEATKSFIDGFNMAKLNDKFLGYKFRIVEKPYELTEKVLINEAGYDDRVMEILKESLKVSSPKGDIFSMVYANDSKYGKVFLCLDNDNNLIGMMPFNDELYQFVYDSFYDKAAKDESYEISQEWAKEFLNEVEV